MKTEAEKHDAFKKQAEAFKVTVGNIFEQIDLGFAHLITLPMTSDEENRKEIHTTVSDIHSLVQRLKYERHKLAPPLQEAPLSEEGPLNPKPPADEPKVDGGKDVGGFGSKPAKLGKPSPVKPEADLED